MGEILNFPRKAKFVGYAIPLYTQEEIDVVLLAMNSFAFGRFKVTEYTISKYDPEFVIRALFFMVGNKLFSKEAREVSKKILSTVKEIPIYKIK